MEKEDVVYIHNGILLNHKKKEIMPLAMTWMELGSIMPSKIVRERQTPYDFTHVWNLRNQINEQKEKERDKPRNILLTIENKLMVTRGEVGGQMGEIGDGD